MIQIPTNHSIQFDDNGKRIITSLDVYCIEFLLIMWFNDIIKFHMNRFDKIFDKNVFSNRDDRYRLTQHWTWCKKQFATTNSIVDELRHHEKASDAMYNFNDYIDSLLEDKMLVFEDNIFKKLCNAGYKHPKEIAILQMLDCMNRIEYTQFTELYNQYHSVVPSMKSMEVLIPKLLRPNKDTTVMCEMANMYSKILNPNHPEIDLNSKKLGLLQNLKSINDIICDFDTLIIAWDKVDEQ